MIGDLRGDEVMPVVHNVDPVDCTDLYAWPYITPQHGVRALGAILGAFGLRDEEIVQTVIVTAPVAPEVAKDPVVLDIGRLNKQLGSRYYKKDSYGVTSKDRESGFRSYVHTHFSLIAAELIAEDVARRIIREQAASRRFAVKSVTTWFQQYNAIKAVRKLKADSPGLLDELRRGVAPIYNLERVAAMNKREAEAAENEEIRLAEARARVYRL